MRPPGYNPPARSNREPRDTAAGCRALAAAEMKLFAEADGFLRRRLARSAAGWTARASQLELDEVEYAKWANSKE